MKKNLLKCCLFIFIFIPVCSGFSADTNQAQESPQYLKTLLISEFRDSGKTGETIYWNPQFPLIVEIKGITNTKIIECTLEDGVNKIPLDIKSIEQETGSKENAIRLTFFPVTGISPFSKPLVKIINGDNEIITFPMVIDSNPPEIEVIASSPNIKKGGSAIVFFRIIDDNLKTIIIRDNEKGIFYPQPVDGKNEYVCFLAWPVYLNNFVAEIIALDKAGNSATNKIPIKTENASFTVSRLSLGNSFSYEKVNELSKGGKNVPENPLERYAFVMEGFNQKREINIVELTSGILANSVKPVRFKPFNPLPGARITSPYGDHRYFILNKKVVRDSYHLGVDSCEKKRI